MKNQLAQEFEIEAERTREFEEKLNKFKKASKKIKSQNTQQIQKLDWNKEQSKLLAYQRILEQDLHGNYLSIDLSIQSYRGIKVQKFYFSTLDDKFRQALESFSENLWYQVRSFRKIFNAPQKSITALPPLKSTLKSSLKQNKLSPNQMDDAQDLMVSIKDAFLNIKENLEVEYNEINATNEYNEQNEQNDHLEFEEEDDKNEEIDLQDKNIARLRALINMIQKDYANDSKMYMFQLIPKKNQLSTRDEISLIDEYLKALRLLYERYDLECEKLNFQIQSSNDDLQQQQNVTLSDQLLYLAQSNSMHCMQRLQLHFPQYSRAKLQGVVDWARKIKEVARKVGMVRKGWSEEYGNLEGKTERILTQLMKQNIERYQSHANQLELKQNRINLLEELEEKRVDYDAKMKEKQGLESRQKEQELMEKRQQELLWQQHKTEIDRVALQYKQQKAKKQREEEDFIKQQKVKQEIQQLRSPIKSQRGNERHRTTCSNREIGKIYDRLYQKEITDIHREENEERIEQAVQGYAFRPKPQFDSERLVKETEGRIIRKQTKYDKADKIALTQVNGYNITQLMGDMRFRLQAALGDQGLANTEYGHQVMLSLNKRSN